MSSLLKQITLLVVLLATTTSAVAHPAPFSYLDIQLEGGTARGTLVVHDFDAAHELALGRPEQLLNPDIARMHRDALIALLEPRLKLRSGDATLTPRWGEIEVLAPRQSLRLPFTLDGPVGGTLDIDALLFSYDPNHQTFINVYEDGSLKQQVILDSRTQSMRFYAGTVQGRWAVVRTFAQAGVHHILIGPDHILFLLGLMLLGGSLWRLATIVTAFTIGHSLTLSLATLGVVTFSPRIVEPLIALSIIVVGVDNLLVRRQRAAQPAAPSRDLRPWLAGIFGLIHGFGFAAVLIEFGLPGEALGWSLAAFNLGVEAGQLAIVVTVIGLSRLIANLPTYRPAQAERFLTVGSVAVIAAGVYWLVERLGLTGAA